MVKDLYIRVVDRYTYRSAVMSAMKSPWRFSFPGGFLPCYQFDVIKKNFHGNSKLLLHLFHNDITNGYDMQVTTASIEKTYPQNKGRKLNIVSYYDLSYNFMEDVFGEVA